MNYKYYSLFPKHNDVNQDSLSKRTKIKNKINIFLNTKKNLKNKLVTVEQDEDVICISSDDDLEDEEKFEQNKDIKVENKEIKLSNQNIKEHKVVSNKNKQEIIKPKNQDIKRKIIEKDYEDEHIYKDTIMKDDFFVIN